MVLLTIHPTRLDQTVAREVSAHTDRRIERGAEALTWGADEHVLLALAAPDGSRRAREARVSAALAPIFSLAQ